MSKEVNRYLTEVALPMREILKDMVLKQRCNRKNGNYAMVKNYKKNDM